ncbi:hypothetical protein NDU88_002827 [Pleurodeles waltl]|uniref:Uncharacterized protein n=1 Tax=Pleurodeles waltl TaxID=8319 RepID=A0AAV7RB46_PLEWA|nr:hypothetical protein NDU88_002827 [Pleurodeles waltl]
MGGVAWRHGGSSFFLRLPPFSPHPRGYNTQFGSRFRTEGAECMVHPRAIDVRLLTPRNCWFGLRHERARCELEESSRRQDGGCWAVRDLGGQECTLGHRLG